MTPATRRPALSDLREARAAERAGDWRHACWLRQMVAMMFHFEGETWRGVRLIRGTRGRYKFWKTADDRCVALVRVMALYRGFKANEADWYARRGRQGGG